MNVNDHHQQVIELLQRHLNIVLLSIHDKRIDFHHHKAQCSHILDGFVCKGFELGVQEFVIVTNSLRVGENFAEFINQRAKFLYSVHGTVDMDVGEFAESKGGVASRASVSERAAEKSEFVEHLHGAICPHLDLAESFDGFVDHFVAGGCL